MPAIQLSKLQKDITDLLAYFYETDVFINKTTAIYENYANYSLRPSQEVSRLKNIITYNAPQLLTEQFITHLKPAVLKFPDQAQKIIDLLWQSNILDIKILAARLLCTLSDTYPNGAMVSMTYWCQPLPERYILELIFANAARYLISRNSLVWINQVVTWLNSINQDDQLVGIVAARYSVNEPDFINLPPIFDNITNQALIGHADYFYDLQTLLIQLAKRSPSEMKHFIRQLVGLGMTEMTHKLLRKVIEVYPRVEQQQIKSLLKTALS